MADFILRAEKPTEFAGKNGEVRYKQRLGLYEVGGIMPGHVWEQVGNNPEEMYKPGIDYDVTLDFFKAEAGQSVKGWPQVNFTIDRWAKMEPRDEAKPAKLASAK